VSAGLPVAARYRYYGIGLVVKTRVRENRKQGYTVFHAACMQIKEYYTQPVD